MHLMFELFSDIFARRDNRLTRLDPRLKLLVAVAAILGVILSKGAAFPLAILLVVLATLAILRIPVSLVAMRLAAPMGIVLVLVALQSLLTGRQALCEAHIMGIHLMVTREGLATGLLMGARVFAAVSVVLLLSLVTPAHRIFHALRWLGAPAVWVEIAVLMYRYLFTLLDLVTDMMAAQRLRLGCSSFRQRLTSASVVAGTVVIRSIDQAMRTHEAMVLRGYRGQLPFGPLPPLGARNWRRLAAALGVLVALHFFLERSVG